MADTTQIDTLQEQRLAEATQLYRRNALRHTLSVLDPQPGDVALDYRALLGRLQAVLEAEVATLPPPAPEEPSA
jgi:hypothetical protein